MHEGVLLLKKLSLLLFLFFLLIISACSPSSAPSGDSGNKAKPSESVKGGEDTGSSDDENSSKSPDSKGFSNGSPEMIIKAMKDTESVMKNWKKGYHLINDVQQTIRINNALGSTKSSSSYQVVSQIEPLRPMNHTKGKIHVNAASPTLPSYSLASHDIGYEFYLDSDFGIHTLDTGGWNHQLRLTFMDSQLHQRNYGMLFTTPTEIVGESRLLTASKLRFTTSGSYTTISAKSDALNPAFLNQFKKRMIYGYEFHPHISDLNWNGMELDFSRLRVKRFERDIKIHTSSNRVTSIIQKIQLEVPITEGRGTVTMEEKMENKVLGELSSPIVVPVELTP